MRWSKVPSARLSAMETRLLRVGVLALAVAVGMAVLAWDARGAPRAVGSVGLLVLVLCAAWRGVRSCRASVHASLPAAVGRTPVRIRPAFGFVATSIAVAVVLPLVASAALLATIDWVWLLVAGVCLTGAAAAVFGRSDDGDLFASYRSAETAEALLQRLCIVADIPVPRLVIEYHWRANAWTAGGEIHVTDVLLEQLEPRELEAVLAHEVAHIARRDAAIMEICTAPSRVLLGFTSLVVPRLWPVTRGLAALRVPPSVVFGIWLLVALTVPAAFVLGWISRVSVLGLSRAREHSADAAAVTLTGSPSALASALLKLDGQRPWTPEEDLRQAEMLCIVGTGRSRLGRMLSTHPSTAARVRRLEALEIDIQSGRQ